MTDYISRETAIRAFRDYEMNMKAEGWQAQLEYGRCLIEQLPADDVRENKRGKWIWHETPLHDGTIAFAIQCSVCKEIFTETDVCEKPMEYNFCPNCGADMREEQT